MDTTTILTTVISFVFIFLFAIQKFGHQIRRVAGERLKSLLNGFSNTPIKGFLSGAFVTGLIQSSTATSVILVGLVNSNIINFTNALGVIIGANVGTSITAQLVALNMTYVAPLIVIAGFIVSHTHSHFRKYGKAIFYFGIIFLSLFIISNIIEPLKNNPSFLFVLQSITSPYQAVLIGGIITVILQSSSALTALIIILASGGLITLPISIGLLLGSAVGSPLTALIASTTAHLEAKKVAMAHVLFNVFGLIFFFTLLHPFMSLLQIISSDATQQIVNAHFIFNATCALISLVFFNQYKKVVEFVTCKFYKN